MAYLRSLALLALSGCGLFGQNWEGIWLVQMPVLDASSCEVDCDHNFEDAGCVEVDSDSGDWTYEIESTISPGAYFLEVFKGKKGEMFGVINGQVYTGTATGSSLTLSWVGSTDDFYSAEHDEGYYYENSTVATVTETFTITTAGGVVKGVYSLDSSAAEEWKETDEWDPQDNGGQGPQIPSTAYLEGDDEPQQAQNSPANAECGDDECELSITETCNGSVDLIIQYVGDGEGQYDGVKDASQSPGVGFSY